MQCVFERQCFVSLFFFFERVRLSRGKDSCLCGCAGAIVAEDATRVQRRDC